MIKALALVVLAACVTNPPPQYPQYRQQPQGYQQPPPPPPGSDPTGPAPPLPGVPPAAPPPKDDLPIDPSQPMPATTLGTDAKLVALEAGATVMVDGRADVFSAAMIRVDANRGGVMPSTLTLLPGGGYITVGAVKGKTGCDANTPAALPDGGSCAGGDTNITAGGNASGVIDHAHTQFLAGLFLGTRPGAVPKALEFTRNESFTELAPLLGQTFFIGDGLTGSGTGDPQKFKIPAGAVRLYLGYVDGFGFQGAPGWYADNTGGVSATVTQHK